MLLSALLLALSANASSYSKGGPPAAGRVAVTIEEPPPLSPEVPPRAVSMVSSGEVAALVMLLGFLGLIGGMLVRWSSDTSWKEGPVIQ